MTVRVYDLQNGGYTGQDDRNHTMALMLKSAVSTAQSGILPSDGSDFTATAAGGMIVDISAGDLIIKDASGGAYVFHNDNTAAVTITTAPSSGTRYDLIIARVFDNAAGDAAATGSITLPGSAGTDVVQSVTGDIEVVPGAAGGSPSPPALPNSRCVILKIVAVGTNVTSINSGNLENTQGSASRVGFTVAAGGILPCSSSATYPATPYVGQTVYDLTLLTFITWNGTKWFYGPQGIVASNLAAVPGNYASSPILAVTYNFVAGRKYKISANFKGIQQTSTGILNVALGGTGIPTALLYLASITAGATAYGATVAEFVPGSSASVTVDLNCTDSAGSLNIANAGDAQLIIEDCGT